MAGHSKWANIKHRKERQDIKKGKIFSKLIRELTLASKQGCDPDKNPRLRVAVEKAILSNITKDTIQKAILRGISNNINNNNIKKLYYEGYCKGVAIIISVLTDNRNRITSEIRHICNKYGCRIIPNGSLNHVFKKIGKLHFSSDISQKDIKTKALSLGIDDIIINKDNSIDIYINYSDLSYIDKYLKDCGFNATTIEIDMIPLKILSVDINIKNNIIKLYNHLFKLDDVKKMYLNINI